MFILAFLFALLISADLDIDFETTGKIKIRKNSPEVQWLLDGAKYEAQHKNFPKAIDDLQKAIRLDPRDAELYVTLASILHHTKKINKCEKVLKDAIEQCRKIPEELEILTAYYKKVLNQEAKEAYEASEWTRAVKYYKKLIQRAPDLHDAYLPLAKSHVNNGAPEKAILALWRGAQAASKHSSIHYQACSYCLRDDIRGLNFSNTYCVPLCKKAIFLVPRDQRATVESWMGLLYLRVYQPKEAIPHFRNTVELQTEYERLGDTENARVRVVSQRSHDDTMHMNLKKSDVYRFQLANALRRGNSEMAAEALKILEDLVTRNDVPAWNLLLAQTLANHRRISARAKKEFIYSNEQAVKTMPNAFGPCERQGRTLIWDWSVTSEYHETIPLLRSSIPTFKGISQNEKPKGKGKTCKGCDDFDPFSTWSDDTKNQNIKQLDLPQFRTDDFVKSHKIFYTKIDNMAAEAEGTILFTNCAVFAGSNSYHVGLPTYLALGKIKPVKHVACPVVFSIHQFVKNYYHWLADNLVNLVLSYHYLLPIVEKEIAEMTDLPDECQGQSVKIVVPDAELTKTIKDGLWMTGIPWDRFLFLTDATEWRYDFTRAYILDWKAEKPRENDMHEMWFPPRTGLDLLRTSFHQNSVVFKDTFTGLQTAPILYISRDLVEGGIRSVPNGDVLVANLQYLYGPQSVLTVIGHRYTLAQQVEIFRNAKIIIGPHGAGLTNLIWANKSTAVIEFGMEPLMGHFSHLALALEMDYYLVREITTWYEEPYPALTTEQIQLVLDIVKHVVKKQKIKFPQQKITSTKDDL